MRFNHTQPPTDEYGKPISNESTDNYPDDEYLDDEGLDDEYLDDEYPDEENPKEEGVVIENLRIKGNGKAPNSFSNIASPFDKIYFVLAFMSLSLGLILIVCVAFFDVNDTTLIYLFIPTIATGIASFIFEKIGTYYFKKWGGKTRPTIELFR